MRALIVSGAPTHGLAGLISRIAGRHDEVIAADAGATPCLEAGVVPDLVVGDLDSITPRTLEELEQMCVPIMRFPVEKDATDLELAVEAARDRGASSVTLTGAVGGRLDHTLAAIGALLLARDLGPRLMEPDMEGWLLAEEGERELNLGQRIGETLSLLPLTPCIISVSGCRYPLDNERLDVLSSRGVSNVCTEEMARIKLHSGTLLVLLLPAED